MMFLPYENITYKTKLKNNEIINKIQNLIEPKKIIRLFWKGNEKPYEGEIYENKFKMKPIYNYRIAFMFLPVIFGTIINDFNINKINVKMKLNILAIIIMILIVSICTFGIIIGLFGSINDKIFILYLSIITFIICYCIIIISFKIESKKTRKLFEEIFISE
jgi:hypothetical protein